MPKDDWTNQAMNITLSKRPNKAGDFFSPPGDGNTSSLRNVSEFRTMKEVHKPSDSDLVPRKELQGTSRLKSVPSK
jgi:hypothetical protein